MSAIPSESVGLVTEKTHHFDQPLHLRSGHILPKYDIIYETYGILNASASNAILICHALSSNHHAAGLHHENDPSPGWWENCIGPNKPIDTRHFFIVCMNNLGGCAGSTGPSSLNPNTGKPYGPDFPIMAVRDWVTSQKRLADVLGIQQWAAVIGGSLGGMQVLRWALQYPNLLRHAIIIASAPKLSAQNIAFNEVARQAIAQDPNFYQGRYLEYNTAPSSGLIQARMLAHLTYLSDDAMKRKFGRELKKKTLNYDFSEEFQVESYLRYQGEKFSKTFDANTYMLMTKALDYFDPAADHNGLLANCLEAVTCQSLVISFTSDWRFPPKRSEEIVDALIQAKKPVTYACIEADQGHDAFLLPIPRYLKILSSYLLMIANKC